MTIEEALKRASDKAAAYEAEAERISGSAAAGTHATLAIAYELRALRLILQAKETM